MTNATGDWTSADPVQNVPYFGEGRRDLFSSSSLLAANRLYLDLRWTSRDQNAEMFVRVDGRGLVNAANNSMLDTRNGESGALQQVLDATFEEWEFIGRAGIFTAVLGNRATRGKTGGGARLVDAGTAIQTMWLDRYVMANMGFVLPVHGGATTLLGDARHAQTGPGGLGGGDAGMVAAWTNAGFKEVNSFRRWGGLGLSNLNRPYFMLSTSVIPSLLTIDIAGDMSNFGALDPNSYTRFGGGIRFSSDLADLLTLDLIYKIHGGDPNTRENAAGNAQPDGLGRTNHVVGLVTRLHLIDALGITFGYSVMVNNFEDNQLASTRSPVLHGIDLRFNFNAIDNLIITFNNNISFSTFRGSNDANTADVWTVLGTHGIAAPVAAQGREMRQGYFGMYNILGVRFMMSDNFGVNLHLQNTLRRFTASNNLADTSSTRVQNQFIGQAVAEYGLTTNVLVGGGLGFIFNTTSQDFTNGGVNNYSVGTFTFSVPLRFRVTF